MNGVIIVNKPLGKSSHDCVSFVRRMTKIRKVGHTGTLDPIATGVLPVCIGKATKACELLTSQKKAYTAQLVLGMTTDTLDCEGEILTEQPVLCSEVQIREVIMSFVGEIEQIPPMYSAIKKDGKKLYELARQGISVEREKRKITIYSIDILEIDIKKGTVTISVECSKGTYIRTLCDDIGLKLGCGAYMNSLIRTKSGSFEIEKSYTFEQIEKMATDNTLCDVLIAVDELFEHPKIVVDKRQRDFIVNGVRTRFKGLSEGQDYRVYDENGDFLCISECIEERLTLKKAFWSN